ncbi:MAG: phosphotyrosine protein phosphatase [Acidobacteriota bacterium]
MLFVCRLNRSRSASAERLFCKRPDLDVRSAGTHGDAMVRVNQRMLDWAEVVFTMDDDQRRWLDRSFPGHPAVSRLICLDIPDIYQFLEPALVTLLEERVAPHLNRDPGALRL